LEGEGDCDSDSDCAGSLVCGTNNCDSVFAATHDCCTASRCDKDSFLADCSIGSSSCLLSNGRYTGSCCTSTNQCLEGEGDCDSDSDCAGSLVCGTNNCDSVFAATHDCCEHESYYIAAGDYLNAQGSRWTGFDYSYCTLRDETQSAGSAPTDTWNIGYNIATSCCEQDGSGGVRPDCNAYAVTYDEAKAVCEDNGYRLCSLQELLWDRITDEGGCGFDDAYNWVSDPCNTASPTPGPTNDPTVDPTIKPTSDPSVAPTTASPSVIPTMDPTNDPTNDPSTNPTLSPSVDPTRNPTSDPTVQPTNVPSAAPTSDPTKAPTSAPTTNPSADPTTDPTATPTADPSNDPTNDPTPSPTVNPTSDPTTSPSVDPTVDPTIDPTSNPTSDPTVAPTTAAPSVIPTMDPTADPTNDPSRNPTGSPSVDPTRNPTDVPSAAPTSDSVCVDELFRADGPIVATSNNAIGAVDIRDSMHFEMDFEIHSLPTDNGWKCPFNIPSGAGSGIPRFFIDGPEEMMVLIVHDLNLVGTRLVYKKVTDVEAGGFYHVELDWYQDYFVATVNGVVTIEETIGGHNLAEDQTIWVGSGNPGNVTVSNILICELADPTPSTPNPSVDPTVQPTNVPSAAPTSDPTSTPTSVPTTDPSTDPTADPTPIPTADPSNDPTSDPTAVPTTGCDLPSVTGATFESLFCAMGPINPSENAKLTSIGTTDTVDSMHYEFDMLIHSWPTTTRWFTIWSINTKKPCMWLDDQQVLFNGQGRYQQDLELNKEYHFVIEWDQDWFYWTIDEVVVKDEADDGHETFEDGVINFNGGTTGLANVTITNFFIYSSDISFKTLRGM